MGGWFNVFVCVVCVCVALHVLCVLVCLWLRYMYIHTCVKSCLCAVVLCCVMLYGVCVVFFVMCVPVQCLRYV